MKVTRLLFLTMFVLGLNGPAARADWNSTISAANPLHWFAFEETEGTTADDQGSGDANGTYTGNVGLGAAGLVGKAASFDGASHVLVGAANLVGDWTVETIFQADTVNGGASMGLLGCDFDAAAGRMAIKADQWNKTGKLGYTVFGVVDVTLEADTPTDFTHVVLVGSGTGVEAYVNGVSVGSDTTTTELARYALGTGAVRGDGTLVDGLTGMIDELVIYDRALSAGDVASHYAAVPEPASMTLSLIGLLGLLSVRRRK